MQKNWLAQLDEQSPEQAFFCSEYLLCKIFISNSDQRLLANSKISQLEELSIQKEIDTHELKKANILKDFQSRNLDTHFKINIQMYRNLYEKNMHGQERSPNENFQLLKTFFRPAYNQFLERPHKDFPELYFSWLTTGCKNVAVQPQDDNTIDIPQHRSK